MIQLENIKKDYMSKKQIIHAVNDVNLTINDGEIYGVIGFSGAGKSTLVRLINQLEKVDEGKIIIDELDMTKLSSKELRIQRQKIGMIFQHFNLLWSRTVEKNIEFPLEIAGVEKIKRKERVRELIQLVGLEGRENAYPSELSGGQKQRVGIARALANNPKILLCDEATSALDPTTTDSILELLLEINKRLKITIVMITHQMEVVQKICHKIAVMVDGKIVEDGDTKQIFEEPKHEVTKKFISNLKNDVDNQKLHNDLKSVYPDGILLKLVYKENIAKEPILAKVIRCSELAINVVHANLTNTLLSSFGIMYINVYHGSQNEYDKLIKTLEDEQVLVEVI